MNKVALIIKREYSSRVKKKSFIIMTILGPLLIAAFYAAAIYIGIQQSDQVEVLLLDETTLARTSEFQDTDNFRFKSYTGTVDELMHELKENNDTTFNRIGVYLPGNITGVNAAKIYYNEPIGSEKQAELRETINDFAEKMKVLKAGIDKTAYAEIQTPFEYLCHRRQYQYRINRGNKRINWDCFLICYLSIHFHVWSSGNERRY